MIHVLRIRGLYPLFPQRPPMSMLRVGQSMSFNLRQGFFFYRECDSMGEVGAISRTFWTNSGGSSARGNGVR